MWFIYSIFRYWKFVLILGMSSVIGFGMWQLERKDKRIYELEILMQEKVFYLESLEDAVDMQNFLIDEMESEKEVFQNKVDEANKRISIIRAEERKKILAILESKSGSTCEDNMKWLLKRAQKR